MRDAGLHGVVSRLKVFTTVADPADQRPDDLVRRQFSTSAPNRLWVADLTYVRTWAGFCYVAFVVDVYSRMIVGWAAWATMRTEGPATGGARGRSVGTGGHPRPAVHHSDGAVNICRFATPTGSPSSASPARSAAAGTASITHSPRPSMGSTRPS